MAPASVDAGTNTTPSTLKVLCFGDSLTAGYTQWGMQHYPYAVHLRDKLSAAFPSMRIHVDIEGMSGAQVRGEYTGRLYRACMKAKDEPYDWIIIMGGTNDLGWGGQPQEIYDALKEVWDIASVTGANALALNIIEAAATTGTIVKRRDALNALIAEHKQHRWYPMDLCRAVPYFALERAKQDQIWDDGLHLTEEGYKTMGEAIAAHMIELLRSLENFKNIGSAEHSSAGGSGSAQF